MQSEDAGIATSPAPGRGAAHRSLLGNASQRQETGLEHRIGIELTHYSSRGARYRVTYMDQTLIDSARDPEFEACRALLAQGVRGMLATYNPGSPVASIRIDIEEGAKLTTIENKKGARIARYQPRPDCLD